MKEKTRRILNDIIELANRLQSHQFEQSVIEKGLHFSISGIPEGDYLIHFEFPNDTVIDATLYTFRLFNQQGESVSFHRLDKLAQDAGLSEKAISNYKKYLAKFPEDADARVDMAICYYNLNDYNTAISEMETAIKYQPKHQIAYLNLGIVNLAAKNIEASKEWFKKTVELDPNSEAGKRAAELMHSH